MYLYQYLSFIASWHYNSSIIFATITTVFYSTLLLCQFTIPTSLGLPTFGRVLQTTCIYINHNSGGVYHKWYRLQVIHFTTILFIESCGWQNIKHIIILVFLLVLCTFTYLKYLELLVNQFCDDTAPPHSR